MTVLALTGGRVLTAEGLRADATVLVMDGVILDIVARPPSGAEIRRLAESDILAPGFIDVQANGGGGVLFNTTPTAEAALAIAAAHRRYGTTSLLPTLITDRPEVMAQAVAAAREAMTHPDGGVAGIHLEGPFLSPKRPGVHDPRLIRRMAAEDASWITAQAPSLPLLLTLAPEEVEDDFLEMLARAGAILSAGHTAASFERIGEAVALGLTGVTHLYNAMPPLVGREPGPVGAALLDDGLWCGLIVDGVHVHAASLKLALAARPAERMLLVTDAMSVLGTTDESFQLYGETIVRRRGRLERADGTLAGADLDMATAVHNSVSLLGLDLARALRMASTYPAAFMHLTDRGRIAPGLRADFVLLSETLGVRDTWVGGRSAALSG
ncbi:MULTISPECIES: N-acetylglucosamine-6-phosphate deacetylase [unclassified Acidisoma]|jgi:N-acetylglucosamine-6-phosphate deacetylase|uniref:N-acetylglucosamine-6-phosphate deacetylase n=1 Tax=unclassified Acidisoma TaxID=2634065 RepID=UPI00131BB79B|nr:MULTISPECIES: N-acetylglucosamine-6-phosphate deacetylase [unclassified Acidisoma]